MFVFLLSIHDTSFTSNSSRAFLKFVGKAGAALFTILWSEKKNLKRPRKIIQKNQKKN